MSKSNLLAIEKTVRKNVERYFTGDSTPTFIVAVSGGMDSMCLLHLFKELGISAFVSHINYQKRGEASDKDAELVQNTSFEWGFDGHIATVDPSEGEGENFQQWARQIRYDTFRHLAKEQAANGIAIAHHEDDQIETILQKIFRGAGLASWSAMQVWDGEIFRPLLGVSRSQIKQYVQKHAIPFRTDESNLEADFARNFLRNEWLEEVSHFFPGWKKNVLRISDQADNYEQALEWIADHITDSRGLKREAFHTLEAGLQKALILFLIKKQKPEAQITHHSLERISELSDLQTGKIIELSADSSVLRDRDYYVIDVGDGAVFHPKKIAQQQLNNDPFLIDDISLAIETLSEPDFGDALFLDVGKISWPITVRRWKHGDAFRPLGMSGHQQVSDHLTNRKISTAHKKRALVIESFEETLCAVIFPPIKNQSSIGTISEIVKCDTDTEHCLKIKHRN